MAITKITAAHDGRKALNYILGQKGHNGNLYRNEYITGVNMVSPDAVSYADQMEKYWDRASDMMKVQVRRVTQSFSAKELDPNNPDDIFKAHEIGIETGKRFFGDRQFVVTTQTDGKSGLVHNHIFGNNVDMVTNKGMRGNDYRVDRLREISDKVVTDYGVTFDEGKTHGKGYSQAVRTLREKGKYSWVDDIADRVREARDMSTDMDEFRDALDNLGISLREGKYLTFTLNDTSNYLAEKGEEPKKKLSNRLNSKVVGTEFHIDTLKRAFDENKGIVFQDDIETEIEDSEEVAEEPVIEREENDNQSEIIPEKESVKDPENELMIEENPESEEDEKEPEVVFSFEKKLNELFEEESEKVELKVNTEMNMESDEADAQRIAQIRIHEERMKKLCRSSVGGMDEAYKELHSKTDSQYE